MIRVAWLAGQAHASTETLRASHATTSPSTCTITTIEDDGDLVPLGDESGFVERYLSRERL